MNKPSALIFTLPFLFARPFIQRKNQVTKEIVQKNQKTVDVKRKRKPVIRLKQKNRVLPAKEINSAPRSIVQVESALPAFIGYTEKGTEIPTLIHSMNDYTALFGGPSSTETGEFKIDTDGLITSPEIPDTPAYRMFYMLKMFFANGGRNCFIVSAGHYNTDQYSVNNTEMLAGLDLLNSEDLPNLILFPDAGSSKNRDHPADLYKAALAQCAERRDRFLICDVEVSGNSISEAAESFRTSIGTNDLTFGAAYIPFLQTNLRYTYAEDRIQVKVEGRSEPMVLRHTEKSVSEEPANTEHSLYHAQNGLYRDLYQVIKNTIDSRKLILPPGAAVAGVYATADGATGVWKAPANISMNMVQAAIPDISNREQENLNISSSGKSINAIRNFSGKGVLVWGSRTLDGNSSEWKYIPARRLAIMIEKSVSNALKEFKREPNNANTWTKVRVMIEDYLTTLWRAGALTGTKSEQAFFVNAGLGSTMTSGDVRDGRLIVNIGIAPLKPAEFNVLRIVRQLE